MGGLASGSAIRRVGMFLFLLGLLVRTASTLAMAGSTPESRREVAVQWDSWSYRWLGEDLSDCRQDSVSKRLPLYPLLLGVTGGVDDRGIIPTILVQQFIDLASALLAGACAARFDRRAFLPAAGLLLLAPAQLIHSLMILPDSLMVLFCAASGYLWIRMLQAPDSRTRAWFACATGVALAAGAAVKPVMGLAWIVYAVLLLASGSIPWKTRPVLLVLLLAYAGLFSWAWRTHNLRSFGLDAVCSQTILDPFERVLILSGEASQDPAERVPLITEISLPAVTEDGYDWEMLDSIYSHRMWSLIRERPFRILLPHFVSWPGFFKPGTRYFETLPFFVGSPTALQILRSLFTFLALAIAGLFLAGAFRRDIRTAGRPLIALALAWFVFSALISGPAGRAPRYGLTFFWAFAAAGGFALPKLLDRLAGGKR